MGAHGPPLKKLTPAEMAEHEIPLAYRDNCAHYLVPLNKCRRMSFYMPWKCVHERHIYEKCQYIECGRGAAETLPTWLVVHRGGVVTGAAYGSMIRWKLRSKDPKIAGAAKHETI